MLKRFAFLLLTLAPCTLWAQQPTAFWLGQGAPSSSLGSGRDTSSANKRLAMGFLAPASKTLESVRVCIYYKVGTLGSSDGELKIHPDTGTGSPDTGSTLATLTFDPNSSGCKTTTTTSLAVTAGVQYWFVVRNTNATPGSNYFAIQATPEGLVGYGGGGLSPSGYGKGASFQESSDGGSTWSNFQRSNASPYRVNFNDSSYYGFPMTEFDVSGNPVNAADRVYDAREVGNKFTTPANASLKLRCVSFQQAKLGSPTGSLRYRLYEDTTLVATTASMNDSGGGQTINVPLCFSSAQTLSANTTYRVVMGETTQSDASSDAFGPSRVDWDSDASSLALKPFEGTLSKTVCTGSCSGGTWTDTTTSFYVMQLLLEFGDEFEASGGSLQILHDD